MNEIERQPKNREDRSVVLSIKMFCLQNEHFFLGVLCILMKEKKEYLKKTKLTRITKIKIAKIRDIFKTKQGNSKSDSHWVISFFFFNTKNKSYLTRKNDSFHLFAFLFLRFFCFRLFCRTTTTSRLIFLGHLFICSFKKL